MKQNPPNAHRSQIKMCEKRQTRNVQLRFMQNAFRILKPIQKSSKCISVFRNTGANAFAKIQMRLAYEDKRDLYCKTITQWCIFDWLYCNNYYEALVNMHATRIGAFAIKGEHWVYPRNVYMQMHFTSRYQKNRTDKSYDCLYLAR